MSLNITQIVSLLEQYGLTVFSAIVDLEEGKPTSPIKIANNWYEVTPVAPPTSGS